MYLIQRVQIFAFEYEGIIRVKIEQGTHMHYRNTTSWKCCI